MVIAASLATTRAEAQQIPRVPRHFADLSDGLPEEAVTAIAVDPGDADVIFAGVDGFLFKTDDGGGTWRPVLSFPRGLSIDAEMMSQGDQQGSGTVYDDLEPLPGRPIARDIDIETPDDIDLRDADNLEELEELQDDVDDQVFAEDLDRVTLPAGDDDLRSIFPREGPGVRAIRFAGPSSRVILVATPRGLFRSVDAGETFAQIDLPGGTLTNDVRDVAVDAAVPTRLWVATADGTLVTVDGGAVFRRAPDLLGSTPALALVTRGVGDEDMVVVGTQSGLWRSWDGGTTFREMLLKGVSASESVGALAYDERTGITYAGTLRGLFAGEREAALLEPRRALFGEPVYAISVDPRRPRGVAVGLGDRGVVQSDDTGISLVDQPEPLPATTALDLARPPDDPDGLLVATERGLFRFVKGTGIQVTEDRLQRLLRAWKKEPSLRETAQLAVDYSRLDPTAMRDAMGRARLAPLLPQLRGSFRYKRGRPDVEEYIVAVDNPDAFDEDDTEDILDLARDGILIDAPSRGVRWTFFVLATWELDELLYNPAEVAAARQLPMVFNARQRVLNRVETLYSARRRLMAEIYLADGRDRPMDEARDRLRLAELTSLLGAMTGGAFLDLAEERGATLTDLTGLPLPEGDDSALPNPRRR